MFFAQTVIDQRHGGSQTQKPRHNQQDGKPFHEATNHRCKIIEAKRSRMTIVRFAKFHEALGMYAHSLSAEPSVIQMRLFDEGMPARWARAAAAS